VAAVANPKASADRRSMSSMRCLLRLQVRPYLFLPMTMIASIGTHLLSTPVELWPNARGEPPSEA
jgi:hypothetical protein